MATKINPDFYGAENTFISVTGTGITGNVKTCAKNLRTLGYDETYTGGSLDLSASPWGIGESSLSSSFYCMLLNNGSNRIVINEHFNTKKNSPFFIYENSSGISSQNLGGGEVTGDNLRRVNCKARLSPQVNFTASEIQSAISFDNNENIGNSLSGAKPVTYYNYNKSRLLADVVYFIRENSYTIQHDFLVNFLLSPDDFADVEYVLGVLLEGRFEYGTQGQLPSYGNWVNFSPSIGGAESDIPDFYKACYYGNDNKWVRPDRELLNIGYWKISDYWSLTGVNYTGSPITINESDMQTPKKNFSVSDYTNFFGQISRKKQVFTDVSYHWEIKYLWSNSPYTNINDRTELLDGDIMPNAGNIAPFCYMVIDETTYNKPALAYFYAMIHECCFMGLPVIANRYDSTYDIGQSAWIFLPKFDEHLITTGDFVRSNASSASDLVNYSWGDVFGVSMPDYDPDYQPPDPEPEEGDTGDLDNQQLHSLRYNGSNNYYLLTEGELSQFIGFINGLYTGESDPDKKRSIDFMGSNPTDYIVGIYGCGIELTGGASTSIKLGAVDTADAGIYGKAVPTNLTYVNFGNYNIPAYGNFLDFKPYTTIEVYVPLCGTIEVDPAEYVGHNLRVDGLIDYQTGELTARIIRDGKTVTNTLSGSMWVQLPVTAAKMGDYQNNQHQLRMQMLSSVLSFGQSSANAINSDVQSAAGAIAGSAAGGSPTALATPGKAQFTIPQNAASTALSLYNTHYQITHTQPARATASSASSGNALEMYHHAMIFIKRPTFLQGYNQAEYAHTIGHACCINGKISDFSGYTVISAADLDDVHTKRAVSPLQASAQEKQLLKQAMQAGFYINTISPE